MAKPTSYLPNVSAPSYYARSTLDVVVPHRSLETAPDAESLLVLPLLANAGWHHQENVSLRTSHVVPGRSQGSTAG